MIGPKPRPSRRDSIQEKFFCISTFGFIIRQELPGEFYNNSYLNDIMIKGWRILKKYHCKSHSEVYQYPIMIPNIPFEDHFKLKHRLQIHWDHLCSGVIAQTGDQLVSVTPGIIGCMVLAIHWMPWLSDQLDSINYKND